MSLQIRPIDVDQAGAFLEAMSVPFVFDLPDDPAKRSPRIERFQRILEPERTRCAFDGSDMVGTLGAFSLEMTVPGAVAACAGTTMVTVLPTHRRRGALRQMITAHLEEARERGEPIAALWASDSAIYGRFGYGLATLDTRVELATAHASLHRLAPEPAQVSMIDATEAAGVLPEVYDTARPHRPGMLRRSPTWWTDRRLHDPAEERDGATAYRFAVATDGNRAPTGYAQYRMKGNWTNHHGEGTVQIEELIATTPEAAAGLWRFLWSHDLTARITTSHLPVDDPLFELLSAPRRAAPTVLDGLWVRVLDVPAALEARRYPADGSLALEVHDPMGMSGGVFRMEVDDGVASVSPTGDTPDISLDIEDLGAGYAGWSRFGRLHRAGRVAGDPAALARADALFGWDPQPWCPEVF